MNQAPTRIKSRQEVILYINKVGLMNQAPTEESTAEKDQNRSVYLYIQKGGLDESSPYKI
jgi:hypothetical protein